MAASAQAVGGVAQEAPIDGQRAPRTSARAGPGGRVGTAKPSRTGSAQASSSGGSRPAARAAGSAWWRRLAATWKRARPREWRSSRISRHGDGDQDQRDLRRALAVAEAVPGPIDRRREGLHAVILDGAEIGERLEERQRNAGGDRPAGPAACRRAGRSAMDRGPGCGSPRSAAATGRGTRRGPRGRRRG